MKFGQENKMPEKQAVSSKSDTYSLKRELEKLDLLSEKLKTKEAKDKIYNLYAETRDPAKIAVIIGSMLVSIEPEDRFIAKAFIKDLLEIYQLPGAKVFQAWTSNAVPGDFKDKNKKEIYTEREAAVDLAVIVSTNIICIGKLESEEPGICKYLFETYGIQNFGRFSPETWLSQYREREKQGPYGLVIAARDDWNASSYDEEVYQTYDTLRKKIHPSHSLRVIEAESLPTLAKLLKKSKNKYNVSPDFVVWSGHYGDKEFFLGPMRYRKENYKFSIAKDDFQGKARERMLPYLSLFSHETTMILDGCSEDDSEENLPLVTARALGNTFIYPKGKTQIKDFGVEVGPDGHLFFNVQYHFGATTVIAEGTPINF